MTATILTTGCSPFPGAPYNRPGRWSASWRAGATRPATVRRVAHVFPVSYGGRGPRTAGAAQTPKDSDALIMFGLAVRARQMRIEMRARNVVTRMLPDVSGRIPLAATILPGGPRPCHASPAQRLAAALATGVPVALSRDAGHYLCNYLCWRAAEGCPHRDAGFIAFVHVPRAARTSQSVTAIALTLDNLTEAARPSCGRPWSPPRPNPRREPDNRVLRLYGTCLAIF